MRARSLAAVTIAFGIAACSDATSPVTTGGPEGPSYSISDGRHEGGNEFFHFLPPMVPNPKTGGHNVRGLSPVVDICAWDGTACTQPVAHFTARDKGRHEKDHECREHSGNGHEDADDDHDDRDGHDRDDHHGLAGDDRDGHHELDDDDDDRHGTESCETPPDVCRDGHEDDDDDHHGHHDGDHWFDDDDDHDRDGHGSSQTVRESDHGYLVNWHTDRFDLRVGTYRISVSVNGTRLGYADVQVVSNSKRLKKVNGEEYVGLVDDQTLPIKFRIEKGAVDCGGATGTISGTVTVDGVLQGGYSVSLLNAPGYMADGTGPTPTLNSTTPTASSTGFYSFTNLADGTYLVCEADPGASTPEASPGFLSVPTSARCPSPYAPFGYLLTVVGGGNLAGNDFVNGSGGGVVSF